MWDREAAEVGATGQLLEDQKLELGKVGLGREEGSSPTTPVLPRAGSGQSSQVSGGRSCQGPCKARFWSKTAKLLLLLLLGSPCCQNQKLRKVKGL